MPWLCPCSDATRSRARPVPAAQVPRERRRAGCGPGRGTAASPGRARQGWSRLLTSGTCGAGAERGGRRERPAGQAEPAGGARCPAATAPRAAAGRAGGWRGAAGPAHKGLCRRLPVPLPGRFVGAAVCRGRPHVVTRARQPGAAAPGAAGRRRGLRAVPVPRGGRSSPPARPGPPGPVRRRSGRGARRSPGKMEISFPRCA